MNNLICPPPSPELELNTLHTLIVNETNNYYSVFHIVYNTNAKYIYIIVINHNLL